MINDKERKRLERLIEYFSGNGVAYCKLFAEFLLQNGVIMPPVQAGQTVYVIYKDYVASAKVLSLYLDPDGGMLDLYLTTNKETVTRFQYEMCKDYTFEDVGSKVFLNRKDAEEALKEVAGWRQAAQGAEGEDFTRKERKGK